jgi:hypothetical protein
MRFGATRCISLSLAQADRMSDDAKFILGIG